VGFFETKTQNPGNGLAEAQETRGCAGLA